ncbi:MAG: NAD(P)-binding protein [Alphaproteobacteria bacterium]|jgi:choline dehydrogenase-like flavoprotein|nr:NAD(P)-binding protein [Alphaproteobacteria bacterium]
MRIDLADGAAPESLDADICIVGAGPAGIALAHRLARTAHRVLLLEAGGAYYDPEVQDAYVGTIGARPYFDLDVCRLRYFGGTSNHWGGWSRPLDPIDFEARPGVQPDGWPIGHADLTPFFDAAHPIAELGPPTYDIGYWEQATGVPRLPLGDGIETSPLQVSPPTRFGERFAAELAAAERLTVVLNAPVVDLRTDGGGRLDRVIVARPDGVRIPVRAGAVVLACGGLENARLLLNATTDRPAGLGNEHDLVGRYFADHVEMECGRLDLFGGRDLTGYSPYRRARAPRSALPGGGEGNLEIQYQLTPSEALLREHGMANIAVNLLPATPRTETRWALEAARDAAKTVADWSFYTEALARLHDAASHARSVGPGLMETAGLGAGLPRTAILKTMVEPAAERDSRVLLSDERDRHGLRRIRLDWQWTDVEKRTIAWFHDRIDRAARGAGIGRVIPALPEDRVSLGVWQDRALPDSPSVVGTGRHHMCTTRMHDDPRLGVVDRDCRVHSVENLYVAGSSVFTTGGLWNPTLTIVALALRLGDHLAARG